MEITYQFRPSSGAERLFKLVLDPATLEAAPSPTTALPDWTVLTCHQCPHCPLKTETHSHCPLAANLVELANYGNTLSSHVEVDVEVTTPTRSLSNRTSAQTALSSLMGLITATSGCPHTRFLRPMARFHLPWADDTETIYRAASMYLLAQYFLQKRGETADLELEGLEVIYRHLHTVNVYMAKRLRSVSQEDSVVNALTKLATFSLMMPRKIRSSLEDMAPLFQPYLEPRD